MKKTEFVGKLAEKTGLTKKDVAAVVAALEEEVLEIMSQNDEIRFSFGKLYGENKTTKSRDGINPLTKQPLHIEGKTVKGYPKYSASKLAKDCEVVK